MNLHASIRHHRPATATALRTAAGLAALLSTAAHAGNQNVDADWFRDSGYGIFMHLLPGDPAGLARVKAFDVEAVARQLQEARAGHFILTLGQNSGFFNAPNATYDRQTGYAPGERCSTRDLPLDLHPALHQRGIRLMLYLPCQVPNQDARAQQAFGLPQGAKDQPLDLEFARRWAAVIQEWSDRYAERVSGWWFDGGYDHIHFNEAIAKLYAAAAKHGNPRSLVTFNPGVRVIRHTQAEDYTAGELNEPFTERPTQRWLDGSQWHGLTYLGSAWGRRDTRAPAERWTAWVSDVVTRQGVVTLDVGPNWAPDQGPIGTIAPDQLEQLRIVGKALRQPGPAPARVPAPAPTPR